MLTNKVQSYHISLCFFYDQGVDHIYHPSIRYRCVRFAVAEKRSANLRRAAGHVESYVM